MTQIASKQSTLPHLRLTPDQIHELWLLGRYTPTGYLHHLVLSHKRAGWWWRIGNISEFCQKWDIKERTFYRAKAALINEGVFEESITSSVDLRIKSTNAQSAEEIVQSMETPAVSNQSELLPTESCQLPDLAEPLPTESHLAAETQPQQSFPEASDPIQIFKQITTAEEVCVPVENFSLETSNQESISPDRPRKEVGKRNSQASSEKGFTPPILQRAKKLGVNISDRILLEVMKRWPNRVPIALDCLEEKRLIVKHPTRFLQKAIEEDWRPEHTSSAPSGFGQWFDEARRRGVAIASEMRDGVIHIFTSDHHWLPFEQLRRMTWDELSARINPISAPAVNVQAVPILGT